MTSNHIQRIALVGAGGNVGSAVLRHLLAARKFTVTVVTRTESKATFPEHEAITVARGSYGDDDFLSKAFTGNDVVIFALSVQGEADQKKLINAAAQARVQWIIPNEYAADGLNEDMIEACPLFKPKQKMREHIDELSKTYTGLKWIGVSTNPWVENSIHFGLFGIDVPKRTAKLADDAGPLNLSTLNRVGEGIARLLSLPIAAADPRASLQYYANNFVYISSFSTTQRHIFKSIQQVTKTTEQEWKIESHNLGKRILQDKEALAKDVQDFEVHLDLICACYLKEDLGGDYQAKAEEDFKVLGLEEEDELLVVEKVLKDGPARWDKVMKLHGMTCWDLEV